MLSVHIRKASFGKFAVAMFSGLKPFGVSLPAADEPSGRRDRSDACRTCVASAQVSAGEFLSPPQGCCRMTSQQAVHRRAGEGAAASPSHPPW